MVRVPESYAEYLEAASQPIDPGEVVEDATKQEVQWQKGLQFMRAKKHADAGCATIFELAYLYRKEGLIYPNTRNALKAELFMSKPTN